MGHRHVAHTHVVHHSQNGQWAVNGMATFHSNEAANFPLAESVFYPCNDRIPFLYAVNNKYCL
jgi:hypothetical protein